MQLMGLAYLGVNATDLDAWRELAVDVLGLSVSPKSDGDEALYLRMDERQWRVAIHRSGHPGLAYCGWELPDVEAFEAAVRDVEAAGLAVKVASTEEAMAIRSVRGLAQFTAPSGHAVELCYGLFYERNFVSPLGVRFVTEGVGMGHVVLTCTPDSYVDSEEFYRKVMGFRISEYANIGPVSGALMHCTPRHHSLGLIAAGPGPGMHHLMIETEAMDDVGRCWDRCQDRRVPIMLTLGRHSDDHMFSFYLISPSQFGIEYGHGGRLIDPDEWSALTLAEAHHGDFWGHRPPDPGWPSPLERDLFEAP